MWIVSFILSMITSAIFIVLTYVYMHLSVNNVGVMVIFGFGLFLTYFIHYDLTHLFLWRFELMDFRMKYPLRKVKE